MLRKINLRYIIPILAITFIMFSIVACSSGDANISKKDDNVRIGEEANGQKVSYPFEYTDVVDRKVTIEKQPERIVSLSPSNTEILCALGLGDKLVGVTDYCDYPAEVLSKEKVGDYSQPNIEKIVALQPDMVFANNGMQHEIIYKLEEANIQVVVFGGDTFEGVYRSILDAGKITNTQKTASEIVNNMKNRVDEVQKKLKGVEKKSCYFIVTFGDSGNWTAGPGSFIDEMINKAGGENIAGDTESAWAEYSIEKLVEKKPQVILMSKAAGDVEELKNTSGYKELIAVKEGNVKLLDDNLVSRPGPRLVDGLEEIAKAIHPEIFK